MQSKYGKTWTFSLVLGLSFLLSACTQIVEKPLLNFSDNLASAVLAHRCIVHPESALRGMGVDSVLAGIVRDTPLDIGQLE